MPWRKSELIMDQRREFVLKALGTLNFRALCEEYGISTKTGYKWGKGFYARDRKRANLKSGWSDIQNNVLIVNEVKAGDKREIPLSANCMAWISAARSQYSFVSDLIMPLSRAELGKSIQASEWGRQAVV
jgi:hypothetical protein